MTIRPTLSWGRGASSQRQWAWPWVEDAQAKNVLAVAAAAGVLSLHFYVKQTICCGRIPGWVIGLPPQQLMIYFNRVHNDAIDNINHLIHMYTYYYISTSKRKRIFLSHTVNISRSQYPSYSWSWYIRQLYCVYPFEQIILLFLIPYLYLSCHLSLLSKIASQHLPENTAEDLPVCSSTFLACGSEHSFKRPLKEELLLFSCQHFSKDWWPNYTILVSHSPAPFDIKDHQWFQP